jgi:alpha-tubulin suppressor-like RCC1 family protein
MKKAILGVFIFALSASLHGQCWQSVSAGAQLTAAIKTNGTLWFCGNNIFVPQSTTINDIVIPTQIDTATNWKSISIGVSDRNIFAVKANGTLWRIGLNTNFGQGSSSPPSAPKLTQIGTDTNWKSIATFYDNCLAIKTDGTLWAWGVLSGTLVETPTKVGTASDWKEVAAGYYHGLALKTNGTLWAWGNNYSGQLGDGTNVDKSTPIQVGTGNNWKTISASNYYSMAIKSDNTLWAWGNNYSGQLGIGNNINTNTPTQVVVGANNWQSISLGFDHTLALKGNGELWVWGSNYDGQLGDSTLVSQNAPKQIRIGQQFYGISAGLDHSIALSTNSTYIAMGANDKGQLGDGTRINKSIATSNLCCTALTSPLSNSNVGVSSTLSWSAVPTALGYMLNIGTSPLGGQIVNNVNVGNTLSYIPTNVFPLNDTTFVKITPYTATINAVCQTEGFTTYITPTCTSLTSPLPNTTNVSRNITITWQATSNTNGYLLSIGTSPNGTQIVNNKDVGNVLSFKPATPFPYNTTIYVKVVPYHFNTRAVNCAYQSFTTETATNYCSISTIAKGDHVLSIKANGTLWAWGYNSSGQLGNGTTINKSIPTQIGTANDWRVVNAGEIHSVALKANGTLWAWGQLSNGVAGIRSTPIQIGTANDWQSIATGAYHNLAIKNDGTLWSWVFSNGSSFTQIGTANDWKAVFAGGYSSFAIKFDGTLWAWGYNNDGQLGDGTNTYRNSPIQIGTATDWKTLASSSLHTLAIKTDSTLWAWGNNYYGQLGTGLTLNTNVPTQVGTAADWESISAGDFYSLALKTNNSLWAWGQNNYGQLGDSTLVNKSTPVMIGTGKDWVFVSAGISHSLALEAGNLVWTWGRNNYGQIGNGTTTNQNTPLALSLCNITATLQAKAFLQGAFNPLTQKMDDVLRTSAILPKKEPFTTLGFSLLANANANVTDSSIVFSNKGDNSIVDWIMIELRSKNNTTLVQHSRPFLIQKDGDIVALDGVSHAAFPSIIPNQYYVVVRHRNHLGFRTMNPIALGATPVVLNFTNNSIALYGISPTVMVSTSINALNTGDASIDGSVDSNDSSLWQSQNGFYDNYLLNADFNLDGAIDSTDSAIWQTNSGKYEEID